MNAEHYERMEEDEASEDEDMFDIADGKLTFSRVEKVMLLRFFNQAMIKMPNFKKDNDPYRGQLLILLGKCSDPEFILKLSLYGRKHLNVRTASNFLLAYAAMNERCKPFVAKYYASIIVLPSDWLEVAELALTFCKDGKVVFPTSLRKVMAKKFVDFDKYQLGKYNKDRAAIKRRREKKRLAKLRRFANIRTSSNQTEGDHDNWYEENDDDNWFEENDDYDLYEDNEDGWFDAHEDEGWFKENKREQLDVTIKQLIRKLRIRQPVDNVMCLIGKKYPSNMEAFSQSGLPGLFEQEKAGKRMKLPTPETWKTQVSLKGNTAKVWEELIDHKKLPFMAMLRNLRNLILANISEKHHQLMIGKLTNENSVINSKQFPFRFFSAYSVLNKLGDTSGDHHNASPRVWLKKSRLPQKKKNKPLKPTKQQLQPLLARYKTALDKAVKISTTYNIPPLPGRTIIFCDVGDRETNGRKCSSAKGLGEPRTIGEMTVLLSLMCKHACEESRLIVCGSWKFEEVQLNHKDSILANTKSVLELQHALNDDDDSDDDSRGYEDDSDDYYYLLEFADDLIYRKEKIDRWIVVGGNSRIPSILSKKLKVYVDHVRWDLKAFNVNLGKMTTDDTTCKVKENKFIKIFGFSKKVLWFISEGDKGQPTIVDNMDKSRRLEDSEHLRKMKRRPIPIYGHSSRFAYAMWIHNHDHQDLCVQTIEAKDASCLALNSDDRLLAVGFETAAIKTFSTSSYEVTSTLIGHSGGIMSLCFVANVRLCSASSDGTLSLWDIVNGFRIAVMEGHSRSVTSCASDKVGRIVVSVGLDAQIKVWHGITGKLEDHISRDVRPINCLALHPEGKLLVIGSWDSALKIWDYQEKAEKAVLRGHSGSVQEVKFNQLGVHIASIDIFGEVRIWSSQHGCTLGILKNRSFTGVFYSPDLGELLTSSSDGTVKVLSPTLGRCTASLGDSEHGHATCLTFDPFSETFMPDFVVGYHSGSVRMFSSAAGSMMWERINEKSLAAVSSIAFHRIDGLTYLIIGRIDGTCEMFSMPGHYNKTIATLVTHDSSVTGICCFDNIVITSAGKTLNEFRLSNYWKLNPIRPIRPVRSYEEHEGTIMAVAKGRHLASVGRDRMIVVWSTYRSLSVFNKIKHAHQGWITCCSWSSQDDHLVTGSIDGLLKIWDVKESEVKYTLEGHIAMVTGVAYRHGCIVSSGIDGSVKVWSHKGVCVSDLRASNVKCNSCDLFVGIKKEEERIKSNRGSLQIRSMVEEAKNEKSKDSETTVVVVASCYDDGSVKIWNPIEPEERHVLVGHKEEIKAVIAGHRGVVCSLSADGLLKVWSIPSKVPDGSSAENSSAVSCLDVSPDGVLMCCGTKDGFVKLWNQSEFDACRIARSSVRVSIKQVTNLCFVSDTTLAVSSDGPQLSIWKVIRGGGVEPGLSFYKSRLIYQPIVCMASVNRDNQFVTIHLQGLFRLWNVDKMDVNYEQRPKITSIRDPVFGGGHMMDDNNIVRFFVFKHESFEKWNFDVVKRKGTQRQQLWSTGTMTSFAHDGSELLFFGTTEGVVDVRAAVKICHKRGLFHIHSDEVTGMVCDEDILFTCSRDGFVKAFDTSKSVVIGQFLTPFILTSMVGICKGNLGVTKVVCGTESGTLISIEWFVRR